MMADWRARAEADRGVLSFEELRACGLSTRRVRGLLTRGEVRLVHPGVVAVAGVNLDDLALDLAATKWAGPSSFISHRSGAVRYELDGVTAERREVSRHGAGSTPGLCVHRLQPKDRPTTRLIDGITVPHVERILRELAQGCPAFVVGSALDDALRRGLTTLDRVRTEAFDTSYRWGRPGTKLLKRLVELRDDRDGRLRSVFEAKAWRVLKPLGAVPDFEVRTPGGRYFLDFAFPEQRIGIECQSIRWHIGERRLRKDLARDRDLDLAGWRVLYFTWDEVLAPGAFGAQVRAALNLRRSIDVSRKVTSAGT